MALDTSPRQPTTQRLEDYKDGSTWLGQMGTIINSSNEYNLTTGEFSAKISVLVEPYALNEDGTLGRKKTEEPFRAYIKTLSGSNDTLCSSATGRFLATRAKGEGEAAWKARTDAIIAAEDSEGRNCIFQGDALENQRLDLGVEAQEKMHLTAADRLLHRFAFQADEANA